MFTGIVEEAGRVVSIKRRTESVRLLVEVARCGRGTKVGDSIAVNGCCLTVVAKSSSRTRKKRLAFDLLQETWKRTNFAALTPGARVNLERALPVGGRLGGHFVTGHIDGVGRITRWERAGQDHVLDIAAPREILRHVVFKGCIAVDGISLTVAEVKRTGFRLWIIPHTREVTTLRDRQVGDTVNLEADLLAKYVERLTRARR